MRRLILISALILVFQTQAFAQDAVKAVPQNAAQIQISFAPVVKKVTPSVVNIYAKQMVQPQLNPLFADPFFQEFFGGLGGLQMRPRVASSLGSGVIVSEDGLIVTNAHVAENATEINVALSDKREFSAKTVLVDEKSDLALLQLDLKGQKLPALLFADSDTAEVGDLVLAIGNPFGVGQTVTSGIVSATARTNIGSKGFGYYIQTDAAINPGNSGGALVNMAGQLIGINTMIVSKSGGYMGIGFAVPSNLVRQVVASYKQGGKTVMRPWFGAALQQVTSDIAESVNLDRPRGLLIQDVYQDSPAQEAGLKRGDIVLAINGRDVSDMNSVRYVLATQAIGSKVPITILRGGQETQAQMKIAVPSQTSAKPVALSGEHPLSGASVIDLSPAVIEDLSLEMKTSQGVMIKSVRGIAARLGFRQGDIISQINGEKITDALQLKRLLAKNARGWAVVFLRGDRALTLRIN